MSAAIIAAISANAVCIPHQVIKCTRDDRSLAEKPNPAESGACERREGFGTPGGWHGCDRPPTQFVYRTRSLGVKATAAMMMIMFLIAYVGDKGGGCCRGSLQAPPFLLLLPLLPLLPVILLLFLLFLALPITHPRPLSLPGDSSTSRRSRGSVRQRRLRRHKAGPWRENDARQWDYNVPELQGHAVRVSATKVSSCMTVPLQMMVSSPWPSRSPPPPRSLTRCLRRWAGVPPTAPAGGARLRSSVPRAPIRLWIMMMDIEMSNPLNSGGYCILPDAPSGWGVWQQGFAFIWPSICLFTCKVWFLSTEQAGQPCCCDALLPAWSVEGFTAAANSGRFDISTCDRGGGLVVCVSGQAGFRSGGKRAGEARML
jgi:hypothetical protein